jgi:maleylacetoacetate isomerase/maleylpyruvate isomerase
LLTLYTYFRSSAAYRVRIALHLKQLEYRAVPVHLLRHGGEQHGPDYARRNPSNLIPTLEEDALTLRQSLAILEYLEETHPKPPLLPPDAPGRARVRALAQSVACDIHPLNNLRVLRYLKAEGLDEDRRAAWSRHWMAIGFASIERLLQTDAPPGRFCHGDAPTLADCCLVPQVFNAARVQLPLDPYPAIMRIHAQCEALEAFRLAAPQAQPDAE